MTDILGIGSSALSAYRKQLEATGSNIVNANTEGYKRRSVSLLSTGDGAMLPTTAPSISGSGVMIDKVVRASDQYLEQQLLLANSSFQKSQVLSNGLERIEGAVFSMENNLNEAAQAFYDRASDISNNPDSMPARYSFIDAGQRLADEFNRVHKNITSEISGVAGTIDSTIKLVNTLSEQIADVNSGLDRRFANSQPASDLLDQRDLLLGNLSDLVEISLTTAPSGSVTVYLGNSPTGMPLINSKSRMLGIEKIADKINLIFDPYTSRVTAPRLDGGVLSGLIDLGDQFLGLRDIVDRLSLGMSTSVNQLHFQGIDMNSLPGGALFSTETLTATAAPTNSGSAVLTIDVTKDSILNGSNYTAVYNESTKKWTVKSDQNNVSVTAINDVQIDGLIFRFNGPPNNGDKFFAQPLKNSAASMKFIISDVTSIAAGLSINVDSNLNNALKSQLDVTDSRVKTAAPLPPSIGSLLNSASSGELSFRRDGIAYSLLSGSTNTEIVSLGQLSALSFKLEPSEITSKTQQPVGGANAVRVSLLLNKNSSVPSNVSLTLNNPGTTLSSLAAEINRVAAANGHERIFFASVTQNVLVINALGQNTVSNGIISGPDYNGTIRNYSATEQEQIKASEINIFSAEGRQLTGKQYTDKEAVSLFTQNNGFNPQAQYKLIPVENDYKKLGISASTSPLILGKNSSGSDQVKINVLPNYDSPQSSGLSNAPAGSVLSVRVEGLPSIRVAGDTISGKDDIDVASIIENELHATGLKRSWTGALVNLPNVPVVPFKLTIDGVDNEVIFTRTKDQNGALIDSGTFQVANKPDLRLALETVGGMKRVLIMAPPSLSGSAPVITISGASSLGLNAVPIETRLTAQTSSSAKSVAFAGNPASTQAEPIKFTLNGSPYETAAVNFTGNEIADVTAANAAFVSKINTIAGFKARAGTSGPVTITSETNGLIDLAITSGSANTFTQATSAYVPTLTVVNFAGNAAKTFPESINFTLQGSAYTTASVDFTGNEAADIAAANAALVAKINSISGFSASASTNGPVTITSTKNELVSLTISQGSTNSFTQVTTTAPVVLQLETATGGAFDLIIDKAEGASSNNLVRWKYIDGKLELSSFDSSLKFSTKTSFGRSAAEAVGFRGTDLKVSRSDATIVVNSMISDKNGKIVDISDTVSRVGYFVKIDKALSEDLLVGVKGTIDGQRVIATTTTQPIVRNSPTSSDIRVKVLSVGPPGQLEIFDSASGASVATRSWRSGETVNYLDLAFRVNSAARSGDEFQITRNKVRTLDNRNALLISELRTATIFEKYGGTFQEAYSLAASKFGADVQAAVVTANSKEKSASEIKSVLEGKTGVNLDSEASDLIRYQQAYQAAAQVVTAARDMFQTILKVF